MLLSTNNVIEALLQSTNSTPTHTSAGNQWTIPTSMGPLSELVQPVRAIGCNQCWYSPFTGGPHQYVWVGYKYIEPKASL